MGQLTVLWSPSVLMLIGIYIVLGLSLYVVFSAGQFSLGTGGFMAMGAYISSVLTVNFKVNLLLATAIAAAITGVVGALVGFPALRVRGIYLAMATLGWGEIVRVVFENVEYVGSVGGFSGMVGTTVALVWVVTILSVIFVWLLMSSRYGLAFEAIRQDEDAAQQMGLNVTRLKIMSFAISATMTAVGGALYAHFMFFISPDVFDYRRTVFVLMSVVFGGVEIMWGAILGSTILIILPQVITLLEKWQLVVYGIIIMFTMLVRPQGLISKRTVLRWRRRWQRQVTSATLAKKGG